MKKFLQKILSFFWYSKEIQETLVILKPHPENYTNHNQDYFEKILEDYVKENNFEIISKTRKNFSKKEARKHYQQLILMPFFNKMTNYMSSWECRLYRIKGENAIKIMDNFKDNLRKTHGCYPNYINWIRGKKPIYNILHASDSRFEAKREIKRYF